MRIVGVLILLTVAGVAGKISLPTVTANIRFPFAISAVAATLQASKLGTRLMIAGFVYLIVAMIIITISFAPTT